MSVNHRANSVARKVRLENVAAMKEARGKRSPEEQLKLIKSRPGDSKKETARLLKMIEDRKEEEAKKKAEAAAKKAEEKKAKK